MRVLIKERTSNVSFSCTGFSIKSWLLTLISLLFSIVLYATDDYRVSAIPAGLTQDANAVVRKQQETLIIHSIEQATYQINRAVTVLNKMGTATGYSRYLTTPSVK